MSEAATAQAPYLTDAEIAEICAPLVMPAAQRRHLVRLGLIVKEKANGRPLVARAEFDRVMVGRPLEQAAPAGTGPNIVGLEDWAQRRRKRGQKA